MLRHWRRRAGPSQAGLAQRAPLSATAVARLRQGQRRQPHPHTLRQLAVALKLDATEEVALLELAAPHPADFGQMVSPAWAGPAPSTPLIGRESELRALKHLLLGTPPARFVTLTG